MSKSNNKHIKDQKIKDIDLTHFDPHESSFNLDNPKEVREILMEHFSDGEHETFFEILALYMGHIGKSRISRETKIPERTIYNFICGQHKTSSENIFKLMKFITKEIKKKSA